MVRVWLHLSPILIGRIVQNALYNGLELNLEVQISKHREQLQTLTKPCNGHGYHKKSILYEVRDGNLTHEGCYAP